MNILKQPFSTLYGTVPFSKIENKDFLPAFEWAIAEAKKEIQNIIDDNNPPSFVNTIEAMAFAGLKLARISAVFFNLHSAETNDEIEDIAQKAAPKLSEFENDITLNLDLFRKVKVVYDQKEKYNLTNEQKMLLKTTYKSFVRNGALLNEEEKKELRNLDTQLSVLKLSFSKNVLADQNAFRLNITDKKELEGLPDYAIMAAEELANAEKQEGWLFSLDYPSYIPFMTYAKNRELRKKMALANGKKGFQNNENNNEENVKKIAQLRYLRAKLLGYKSHAHFVLEERMAKTPQEVNKFLEDFRLKAEPVAKKEFKELEEFAKKTDKIDRLEKWDANYYSEKLKIQRFSLDDEKLKPYFKLENVLTGVFEIANRLYGLRFKETSEIDKYHDDVKTYIVENENGKLTAVFYADFFPRKGKRNGAWMTSFKSQYIKNKKNERPHVSIVCNFTKPTAKHPSLLTFNEVTTLFHEFGHALHGMLANTVYPALSGTSVSWDFVELPSQIMENWCYEKEALELFAKHYETEELIPMEYIQKIKESAGFLEGMATLRQLSFGVLDMGWHGENPSKINDIKEFEKQQFSNTQLYPEVEENVMSTSFSHIFSGGYSSGYYSYKWAEVLDADAFEYFKEKGIFNREAADKFKKYILSKGGTQPAMELYEKFRGKEPSINALLKRSGLIDK